MRTSGTGLLDSNVEGWRWLPIALSVRRVSASGRIPASTSIGSVRSESSQGADAKPKRKIIPAARTSLNDRKRRVCERIVVPADSIHSSWELDYVKRRSPLRSREMNGCAHNGGTSVVSVLPVRRGSVIETQIRVSVRRTTLSPVRSRTTW